jgi:hypothetical protein
MVGAFLKANVADKHARDAAPLCLPPVTVQRFLQWYQSRCPASSRVLGAPTPSAAAGDGGGAGGTPLQPNRSPAPTLPRGQLEGAVGAMVDHGLVAQLPPRPLGSATATAAAPSEDRVSPAPATVRGG